MVILCDPATDGLPILPQIGTVLDMAQPQFGLWSALAIHDISSVVGATAKYGAVACAVGTTVKLARALRIVPLSVGTAMANKSKARIQWPWFILFFCLAAVANTYVPIFQPAYPVLKHLVHSRITRNKVKENGVAMQCAVAASLWAYGDSYSSSHPFLHCGPTRRNL